MIDQFRMVRIPHLFYRADNLTCEAGHIRIFGDGPGKGWAIYRYNRSGGDDWALQRVWDFGLFCVHHIEHGKKTTVEPGWYITWATLSIKAAFRPPERYNPKRKGKGWSMLKPKGRY